MARMMQGDSYYIDFKLYDQDKIPIPRQTILDVAITIDGVRKVYETEDADKIVYDEDRDAWQYPVAQEESLQWDTRADVDIFVKFIDGSTVGTKVPHIQVTPAQVKEGF